MCEISAKEKAIQMDARVGKRIRLARALRRVTQTGLGERLCVSMQQVQKYERAENRISAGRLFVISEILDVPLDFFYKEDL